MKKRICEITYFFLAVTLSIFISGCGPLDKLVQDKRGQEDTYAEEKVQNEDMESDNEKTKPEKQVLMIYMVGSNLESQNALASADIMEMLESDYDEETLTVLLCTGGASYWWYEGIPTDKIMVYELKPEDGGSLSEVTSLSSDNMSEPSVLTEFLDLGYENYPADSYSLICWNHGGGAVLGYGADENYDYSCISMGDLDGAIEDSKLCENGKRFEWIGFDACLMGMIEVASLLSDNCNYMIASEEVEAGEGWNYDFLRPMSEQSEADGCSLAHDIIDSYANYYEKEATYKADYTLSCLDMSEIADVERALDEFSNKAKVDLKNGKYHLLAKARNDVKTFGKLTDIGFYDTIDLYDLAGKMEKMYPPEAEKLKKSLEKFVVYSRTNMMNVYGVAIYFPYENSDYAKTWLGEYEDIGFSENYVSFVRDFEATLSGDKLDEWEIMEMEPKKEEENIYGIQLPENLFNNYAKANYSVWEEDEPGSYICWIKSGDVNLSDEGMLSTDFNGKRFFLTDNSGNFYAACAIEIERTNEYAKYVIPIMYATLQEPLSLKGAYIHYRVDNGKNEGYVTGIYNSLDTSVSLFPDKTQVKIEEGSTICPFLFARKINFTEDGGVAPFETWEQASGLGSSFTVSGELEIEVKSLEKETQYCCLFQVTDIQGNYSYTNPIYIKK